MDSRLAFTISAVVLSFVTAADAALPSVLRVRPGAERVGMYEKVELVIELEAEFPEAGATSLIHEPGTPGYVTEYHNAVWAGLANGLCATPFWWEYWPEPPVDPLRLIRDGTYEVRF